MQGKDSKNTKKIIIMGLDNSGKTSIVMCLKGVKNLSSFSAINPTRGFEINKFHTLGSEFNIWDFGGQAQFREDYFKNFKNHIKGASKLIYVIDIQDRERYDISLEYLARIIALLKKTAINLEFSLFLHKFDLDVEIMNIYIKDEVIQSLTQQIKDIFPLDFPYQIFKTSIYTVFQKSVL
ncbi:MAG: 50S ribosome-binding GTPase [Candidatus Lokiarchaeota archaeon]|nr:50S ribosome-binding GTPase [Candidatus Lokiarchaeota archaeon]